MTLELQESMTVGDTIRVFLAQLNGTPEFKLQCQQEVNRFIRWLGPTRQWDSITSHDVASYADTMGTTTTDVLKKLDSVKTFLAYAKKNNLTASNLGTNLRPKKSPVRNGKSQNFQSAPEEPAYLTDEGYRQLTAELQGLKAERPKIAEALRQAMADKDFRENAPLDAARDHQAHVEARIRELEGMMKRSVVLDNDGAEAARAKLGSLVVLEDEADRSELKLTLVHPHEANVTQHKISVVSPMGKAVLDRTVGDKVAVSAPSGIIHYRVKTVEGGN